MLSQTETVKTFPCTEREAAESLPVARELKSKISVFNWYKKNLKMEAGDVEQIHKEKRK